MFVLNVVCCKVYRLYTEESYSSLPAATVPEMQRCDMAPVVLQLKALGIDNILRFAFLSPPPAANLVRGVELLFALGAVDANAHLTSPLGIHMAELPLSPMLGRALLASGELGCSEEMLTVAAMMQIENVFVSSSKDKPAAEKEKRRFSAAEGDHVTLLNVFVAFERSGRSSRWCRDHFVNYRGLCRVVELRGQLLRMLRKFKVCVPLLLLRENCVNYAFISNCNVKWQWVIVGNSGGEVSK